MANSNPNKEFATKSVQTVISSDSQSPVALMMTKPSSKKLFAKLLSYFPDKDEDSIKELMLKYNEIEHDIISAIIEQGFYSDSISHRKSPYESEDQEGAVMKVRYLKYLFPDCQEIELYHLLNCNDLKITPVIDIVQAKGYKKIDASELARLKKTADKQRVRAKDLTHLAEVRPASDILVAYKNRRKPTVNPERLLAIKKNIEQFAPAVSHDIIDLAIECADYNEGLAKRLIEKSAKPEERCKKKYVFHKTLDSTNVRFPCKSVQTGLASFVTLSEDCDIIRPKSMLESINAVALTKRDASTFTQDDTKGQKRSSFVGPNKSLIKGVKEKKETKQIINIGKQKNLTKGPTMYTRIREQSKNILKKGPSEFLFHGSNKNLANGHNVELVRRLHPFYRNI